jgi:hypothetical protein
VEDLEALEAVERLTKDITNFDPLAACSADWLAPFIASSDVVVSSSP